MKISEMEMTDKVMEIIRDAYVIQQSYIKSELYQLFTHYEIEYKDNEKISENRNQ